MNQYIEQLILIKRRELYKVLQANKTIRPQAYFIVDIAGKHSEIIIPKAEEYISTPEMKELFPGFIAEKWEQYYLKNPSMKLIAVVFVADMNYKLREMEEGMTDKEMYEKYANFSVVNDPTSVNFISFLIYGDSENLIFSYPYKRTGKRISFIETSMPEKGHLSPYGRFGNLFPKQRSK